MRAPEKRAHGILFRLTSLPRGPICRRRCLNVRAHRHAATSEKHKVFLLSLSSPGDISLIPRARAFSVGTTPAGFSPFLLVAHLACAAVPFAINDSNDFPFSLVSPFFVRPFQLRVPERLRRSLSPIHHLRLKALAIARPRCWRFVSHEWHLHKICGKALRLSLFWRSVVRYAKDFFFYRVRLLAVAYFGRYKRENGRVFSLDCTECPAQAFTCGAGAVAKIPTLVPALDAQK